MTGEEVAVYDASAVPATPQRLSREQIDLIKATVAVGATDDELRLFLYTAERRGLDPLAQQIHFIKRRRQVDGQWESVGSIQVGIDGFRAIAERTGKLSGIKRGGVYEGGKLVAAWAKVWRHDWQEPAEETVRFEEYVQTKDGKAMGLWATKPETMLKKCAEAAALRMAFPQNLSGLYTPDEMGQADTEQPPRLQAPARRQASVPESVKAQRLFWAQAKDAGFETAGDVHAALGLRKEKGALSAYISERLIESGEDEADVWNDLLAKLTNGEKVGKVVEAGEPIE
jgi:phage recombination protein Bet